jgi:hypothetical protein
MPANFTPPANMTNLLNFVNVTNIANITSMMKVNDVANLTSLMKINNATVNRNSIVKVEIKVTTSGTGNKVDELFLLG